MKTQRYQTPNRMTNVANLDRARLVILAVCQHLHLTPEDLENTTRRRSQNWDRVYARWLVIYFLTTETQFSSQAIGILLGVRCMTVLHSYSRITSLLKATRTNAWCKRESLAPARADVAAITKILVCSPAFRPLSP